MTAEVAVMNKLAIALAADSAVTFTSAESQKIYNAANKLFALSKRHPVGVMVYGNAEFMGIPWETIIKVYRSRRPDTGFLSLNEYFEDFLGFLNTNDTLFDRTVQESYVKSQVNSYLLMLRDRIFKAADEMIQSQGSLTDEDLQSIVDQVVNPEIDRWKGYGYATGLDSSHHELVASRHAGLINETLKSVFEEMPLTAAQIISIVELASGLFSKDFFPKSHSGIVVAGFGDGEHFPSLRTALTEARVGDRLKYQRGDDVTVSHAMEAAIVPFAQSDVVNLFIEGIDPAYDQVIDGYLDETFKEYPEKIVPTIKNLSDDEKAQFINEWREVGNNLLGELKKRSKDYIERKFVQPMMNIVGVLPKNELANLAEALVNLTSLKRKVSAGAETVGGPVDVVVISQGDGLIWMRRKHYFHPQLNHQFFSNYFQSPDQAEESPNEP